MTSKRFCSLEIEYGKLYHQYLSKWNWWRDRVFERANDLSTFELRYDLEVNYEQMPKYKQIVTMLEKIENEFVASAAF